MSDAIEAALTAYRETATYPIVPGNHSEAMTAALTAYEAAKSGGVGVAALLDAYDAETSKLPLGHETPSHGRSTFNWRRAVVAELRDLSATLALTSPASGSGQPRSEAELEALPAHPLAAWRTGLPLGLHRVHWTSGGSSLCAVGMQSDGRRWIAPCNWVAPSLDPESDSWAEIERTELLFAYPEPSPASGSGTREEIKGAVGRETEGWPAETDHVPSPASGERDAPQCCMCGKNGLSTTEGDGGAECELADGRWVCSQACYDKAVPMPGGERDAVVEECAKAEHHKLDTDAQVFFYEQDFYVLSNFSSFNLRWHGRMFPTSEHAYHWSRFALGWDLTDAAGMDAAPVAVRIMSAPSAHEAFKLAQEYRDLQHPNWGRDKIDTMRRILFAKAKQHEYVSRKLLATGDRELVEDSWRDDFWGWGPNRDGQNMLGKLWMEVRAALRMEGK